MPGREQGQQRHQQRERQRRAAQHPSVCVQQHGAGGIGRQEQQPYHARRHGGKRAQPQRGSLKTGGAQNQGVYPLKAFVLAHQQPECGIEPQQYQQHADGCGQPPAGGQIAAQQPECRGGNRQAGRQPAPAPPAAAIVGYQVKIVVKPGGAEAEYQQPLRP